MVKKMRTRQAMKLVKKLSPRVIAQQYTVKQTVMNFATKLNLVYFGYVDQRSDEHKLIRGHTLSNTNVDKHYCVGTFNNYDVSMVVRSDDLSVDPKQTRSEHNWVIVRVDLKLNSDLPHIIVSPRSVSQLIDSKHTRLSPIPPYFMEGYASNFINKFSIYSTMSDANFALKLLNPTITNLVFSKLENVTVELMEDSIYLHTISRFPTKYTLEKMLVNSVWLAEMIDENTGRSALATPSEN